MGYSGLSCLLCLLSWSSRFFGTRNSLMVCTQTGNWSFILQDSTISWGKVNIIYMFIPHDFSYAYLYIFFPRTSLNIPSRGGKIHYFGI